MRFFEIFRDIQIFGPFLTIFGFLGFLMDFWDFFGFFFGFFGFFFNFFGIFLDFWDFFGFLDFWNLLDFFGFFLDFFVFFLVSFKVTKVTTKCYHGYYWTPKIAKNGPNQHKKNSFFAQRAKKASAEALRSG